MEAWLITFLVEGGLVPSTHPAADLTLSGLCWHLHLCAHIMCWVACCQLTPYGKREPQLRKCTHYVGLQASLCIFSIHD